MDVDLAKISADFYLQQANYPLALEQLVKIDKLIKRKNKKVRYNYIMAQLYQQSNNNKSAKNKYEQVLKSSPEYEMVFNAKMNLARSLESGSRDTQKMRQKLLKMTKDEKNKEYLDHQTYPSRKDGAAQPVRTRTPIIEIWLRCHQACVPSVISPPALPSALLPVSQPWVHLSRSYARPSFASSFAPACQ